MGKILIASSLMLASALDSMSTEADLTRYAVTQGGLLVVVLVLLYWQRQDGRRKHAENIERIAVLTNLAERSVSGAVVTAEALSRLARAVENMERRQ